YQLIAGERRLRAARQLKYNKVPVVIKNVDDREALEIALIENLQRESLNPIEEARGYRRLADEFELNHEQIAQRIGKTRTAVANSIRLLQLPPRVQEQVASGELTAGHARGILALRSVEGQLETAREVAAKRLTVR